VGLDARFVGHPLLDHAMESVDRQKALQQFGLAATQPVIGLLPGSRPSEIDRLLEPMLDAAVLIQDTIPGAQFIVPVAQGIASGHVEALAGARRLPVTVVENSFHRVLAACDCALVASGTATLETALMGKPMVIVYKVSPLTYLVGRIMIRVPWIGLANIVAGRQVVPELIQHEATPQRLAAEACAILESPGRMAEIRQGLSGIRAALGDPGGSKRVAQILIEKLDMTAPQ
jgi:lipid-A-disaccharide synthase